MNKELKFYKLTYSGSFAEILEENLIDNFNLYNIIAIYSPFKKTLFVWIGKKVAQSLKRHIASIRHTFSREYPDVSILRNITIESGSEPENFFEMIGINIFRLEAELRTQELKVLPVYSEITRLKETADKLFIEENFEKAIEISKIVQNLAREISDETLINDQQSFIEEARIKSKAREIFNEIEKEAHKVHNQISGLNLDTEFLDVYKLISEFLMKYGEYSIEEIQPVQDLILIFQEIKAKSEDKKNLINDKLTELDSQFKESLTQKNLEKAKIQISKAKELLKNVKNPNLNSIWNKNAVVINTLKERIKGEIQKKTQEMFRLLEEKKINNSLSKLNEIIAELENITHHE